MKYACIVLAVLSVLCLMALNYQDAALSTARERLATAQTVNAENAKALEVLTRSMSINERAITGWNEDRTTIAQLRATTRQSIREAMKDEMFKIWATGVVPADGWRMLRQPTDKDGSGAKPAAPDPDAGMPGNGHSGKRQ